MEVLFDGFGVTEEGQAQAITSRQAEYLEVYRKTGSASKTARVMGVREDSVRDALRLVAKSFGKKTISELLEGTDYRVNKQSELPTAKDLVRLIKSQEYRCALTGEKLTPKTSELDHKIPRSKDGSDAIENLQWLDRTINRMKGQMTNEQFIAACKRVAAWNS